MDLDFMDRCDNCCSSLLNDHSESEGIRKIKNYFCETAPEIQLWNALEFIYGVSWESFQNHQLEKKSCLLNSHEDIKFCSNCASLLFENYNTHQNFENACHPSSSVELLKTFRINRNNCLITPPEKPIDNLLEENQYVSELTDENNICTVNDVQNDLFDNFTYEDAEDDVTPSPEPTEIKYEAKPTFSAVTSISHKSESKTSVDRTYASRRATLRPREVVIKLEKLSSEDIFQFKNKRTATKRRGRPPKEKFPKTEPDSSKNMLRDTSHKNQMKKAKKPDQPLSEEEFKARVAEALEKVTDKTTFKRIVIAGRYVCNVCGKSFAGYSQLKFKHWPIHHGTARKEYVCDICGKSVFYMESLKWHKVRVHGTEEQKAKCQTKCHICNQMVYNHIFSQHVAQLHPETPREKYVCEVCGAEYATKRIYKTHLLRHTEGPQKCDICSKLCPSSNCLAIHKRETHGKKKFSCEICPMTFVTGKRLHAHKISHETVRKHVCEECGCSFKHKHNFYRHIKCHREIAEKGEGAFTCDICNDGKRFKHSVSLYKHIQRKHPKGSNAHKIYTSAQPVENNFVPQPTCELAKTELKNYLGLDLSFV